MPEMALDTIESISEECMSSQSSTEEIILDEDEIEGFCGQVKDIFFQIKTKNQRLLNNIIGHRDPYFQKLYIVYEEMNRKKYLQDFWGECALRLQNPPKNANANKDSPETVQLFTFFMVFAIRSLQEKENPAILDFIAQRCSSWSTARDNLVKKNACLFAGYFFQYYPHIFGDVETLPIGIRNDVKRLRNKFYKLFSILANDQCEKIRNQVCLVMEPIQDQDISSTFTLALKRSPKDYILNFLNDKSSLVRQTAVKCLTAIGHAKNCAAGLLTIAAEELNLEVRKLAISKIVHFWPLEVSVEDRELIFYNNLTLDSEMAEHLKKELLSIWLGQLAEHVSKRDGQRKEGEEETRRQGFPEAVHLLIGCFQWEKHDDEIVKICFAVYDVICRLIHRDKTVTLPEMVKMLLEDEGNIVIISRYNRNVLLGDEIPPKHVARYIFLWRSLIQYCYEMTETPKNPARDRNYEAERNFCLQKLAPTLKEMCEFISKLSDLKNLVSHQQDLYYMEIAIVNCLKICYYLDRDTCGLGALKELLEKLLLDNDLSTETVFYITRTLVKEHYARDEQTLLVQVLNHFSDLSHEHEIIDLATEQVDKPVPILPQIDEEEIVIDDGSLASSFIKAEIIFQSPPRAPEPVREINLPRMSFDMRRQEIKIVNAILKTGVFKEMNPYLTRLNEQLIPECIGSKDDETTAAALNAFTIISLFDRRAVTESANLLFTAAKELKNLPKSKIAAMYGFVDLFITFEEDVSGWLEDNGCETIEIFNPLLLKENCLGDQLFAAAEGTSKLLLAKVRDPNDEPSIAGLASLVARCFHPSLDRFPKVKSCIIQCFCVLKFRGRQQMQLLFNSLLYMLNEMYSNADDPFLKEVDAEHAATSVISLCRGHPADEEYKTSLHGELLEAVMEMVSRVVDNPRFVKIYCNIGCILDIDDLDYDNLLRYINSGSRIQENLGREVEMEIEIQVDELDKLINRLAKRKLQIEENITKARPGSNRKKIAQQRRLLTSQSSQSSFRSRSQLPRNVKDSSPGFYSDWFL